MGDKLGDYEIVRRLKAGGMATLFLAERSGASGFTKHVAIKVVHEHLAEDATFVSMFVDEALLSARIQHPNVVHVEELKQAAGRHFLVMEYVNGCSLSQLLEELSARGRSLSPGLAVWITAKVAQGLHAAHELKGSDGSLEELVHRDVSPQNVLLAWEGHVKLIDFGVAKARSRAQQTIGTALRGKIRYMSPEQAHGKPLDRRTDVYALGVVLWEMLTSTRRFRAIAELEVLDKVRNPKPIPPSSVKPELSRALDAVVLKAMAKDPEDRYATAQEMRRALASAAPEAFTLDAAMLAELLVATMGQAIESARAALPDSLELPASVALAPEETNVLRTLTVAGATVGAFFESTPASGDGLEVTNVFSAADSAAPSVELSAVPTALSAVPTELQAVPTELQAVGTKTSETVEAPASEGTPPVIVSWEAKLAATPETMARPEAVVPEPAVASATPAARPVADTIVHQARSAPRPMVLALALAVVLAGALGVAFFATRPPDGSVVTPLEARTPAPAEPSPAPAPSGELGTSVSAATASPAAPSPPVPEPATSPEPPIEAQQAAPSPADEHSARSHEGRDAEASPRRRRRGSAMVLIDDFGF